MFELCKASIHCPARTALALLWSLGLEWDGTLVLAVEASSRKFVRSQQRS